MVTAARTAALVLAALFLLPACGAESPENNADASNVTGEGADSRQVRQPPPLEAVRVPSTELHESPALAGMYTTEINQGRQEVTYEVHVAVWEDGTIIWSDPDAAEADEPRYLQGRVDPARVEAAMEALTEAEVLVPEPREEKYFGRSANFRTIAIAAGEDRRAQFHSWHELIEEGQLSAGGRDVLGGGTESEAYQQFLTRWDAAREQLTGLIPETGEPVEPDFMIVGVQ